MDHKDEIRIFEDLDAISEAVCNFILATSEDAIRARGRFVMALSGGHTPNNTYNLLSSQLYRDKMDWSKTFIFWGDERYIPVSDNRNNSHMARMLLLERIVIPTENIFAVPVNVPPAEAADEYERSIRKFFGNDQPCFDLILLGLGENGHTASLFPGTPVVQEQIRWVKEVYLEDQDMYRITMTVPLINQARNIIFLVSGHQKAAILKTVREGTYQPDKYPAQMIKPGDGELHWFVDKEAAGR